MGRISHAEEMIFNELRLTENGKYRRVKWKDVMEWTTGEPKIVEGEYTVKLPSGINVAIKGEAPK